MAGFTLPLKVGFQHCDPAGLVFYPRYFEMVNTLIEEWFARALAIPFEEIHGARQEAVPTATISADFVAPSQLGDVLNFALEVEKLGGASLHLSIRAACAGDERLKVRSVLVHTSMVTRRPSPWPADLRAAIENQVTE